MTPFLEELAARRRFGMKPGLETIRVLCAALGDPQKRFRSIHVAGTNGKGAVCALLEAALRTAPVGRYTSPHLVRINERFFLNGEPIGDATLEAVAGRVHRAIGRSARPELRDVTFFEALTAVAFELYAEAGVGRVVLECGLGGRLDATNVCEPELCVITRIGLDHCDWLGDTVERIAAEKAGIFKKGVPALVGETRPETEPIFRARFVQVNANVTSSLTQTKTALTFADQTEPSLWYMSGELLRLMDLQGEYQARNLRTVMAALDILRDLWAVPGNSESWKRVVDRLLDKVNVADSLIHTASRMDFHGRWERLSTNPDVICDIGHNAPALTYNFGQLKEYLETGRYTSLIMVYGVMADKNFDAIMPLFPENATWIFTTPKTRRSDPASDIKDRYTAFCEKHGRMANRLYVQDSVRDAVAMALKTAAAYGGNPLVYIGGSTFVVSEAVTCF